MAREFSIEVEAANVPAEWRTFDAHQVVEKNKDPILNWQRERPASSIGAGVEIARKTQSHQRLYSAVANQTVEIHDAAGNLVTIKVAGLFEGNAKVYDRWSEEDGESVE